jgi:Flp pilus assembly protein protease CpaA
MRQDKQFFRRENRTATRIRKWFCWPRHVEAPRESEGRGTRLTSVGAYCSLGVLAIATIDDIKTRRVHNILLAGLALLSIAVILVSEGWPGLEKGFIGSLAGFALYFPLAWMGVVGGGDLKLMAVVGLSAGAIDTLVIGLIALVWGAALGVIQVLLNKDLKSLLQNVGSLARGKSPEEKKLHKIPFAAAIFLAALTEWTMTRAGGWL